MKKLHALVFLAFSYPCWSQTVDVNKNPVRLTSQVFYTIGGFPVSNVKYVSMEGSPYFSDVWMKGIIITDSAQYILRMKMDMIDGSLLYLNDKGEEMIADVPPQRIFVTDTTNGKSYIFVSLRQPKPTWFQILSEGSISLYKQYYKDIAESKAYMSSITEQTIRSSDRYFIFLNNSVTRIKKPKEIVDLVSKNKKELDDYIEKNKLNGKNESDFTKAVEYYNSLNK